MYPIALPLPGPGSANRLYVVSAAMSTFGPVGSRSSNVQKMSATEKQPEVADPSSLSPEARAGDQVQGQTAEETRKEDGVSEVAPHQEKNESDDTGSLYDLEPSDDGAFRMGEEVTVDPAIVQQLSDGFLQRFLPSLEKSKNSITEILSNQTVLIDTLEQENAKFKECTAHEDLTSMMVKAKNYHNKLLNIKRDMTNLHEKAAKLKRRALKLQQQKQREELQRAHQQERELEKEQLLTARVARPSNT